MADIDLASKEIRTLPVAATDGTDISGDKVEVAFFTTGTEPADDAWKTCNWSSTVPGSVEVLLNLPGGFDLTVLGGRGTYDAKVRITDSPEVPVLLIEGVALRVT